MIDLYTAATPNGYKISIALEELGLDYETHVLDLSAGDQRTPDFLALNPNGRIPAIVDREECGFPVFESGAILLYLAEKTGRLMPAGRKERSEAIQWLMFQMSGIGPMMGQANVFHRYLDERIPVAVERYQTECRRLFEVLDGRLAERDYICGEFSVVDIATWPWVRGHKWSGVDIGGLDRLQEWIDRMYERPACIRGINVPSRGTASDTVGMARSILVR